MSDTAPISDADIELLHNLIGPEYRRFVTEVINDWKPEHKQVIRRLLAELVRLQSREHEFDLTVAAFKAHQADLEGTIEEYEKEIARLKAVEAHMESCRALLKAPDDEVLYESIKELQAQLAECRAARTRLADPVVDARNSDEPDFKHIHSDRRVSEL